MAAQAVEALIAPAQSAASAGRGLLSSLWSGFAGGHSQKHNSTREGGTAATASGIRTDASHIWQHCPINPTREGWASANSRDHTQDSSTSGGAAASAIPGPGGSALPNLGNPVLDALVMGMHQLQTLQVNQLNNPKKDDAPESVKPGITALPKLTAPDPLGGSLDCQDWLQQIAGLMSDLSDSSHLW